MGLDDLLEDILEGGYKTEKPRVRIVQRKKPDGGGAGAGSPGGADGDSLDRVADGLKGCMKCQMIR